MFKLISSKGWVYATSPFYEELDELWHQAKKEWPELDFFIRECAPSDEEVYV